MTIRRAKVAVAAAVLTAALAVAGAVFFWVGMAWRWGVSAGASWPSQDVEAFERRLQLFSLGFAALPVLLLGLGFGVGYWWAGRKGAQSASTAG